MKKRGIKKRVLAALMTACMVVGSVPGVSLADVETSHSKALGINNPGPNKFMLDGNDYTTGTPDIELNKTATYNSEDGTYTIQLNAKTSDKLTKKKTHVVFLVDASGSMNFCEENATEMAIPDWLVLDKTKHIHYYWDGILTGGYKSGCTKKDANSSVKSRVTIATEAIAKMTENLGTENVTYDYTWFNDNTGSMDNVSDLQTKLSAKDGTYLKEGVEYALTKFNNDEDNENQILVILADGKSDSSKKILICNKNHHHYKTCYKTVDNYYPKEEIENSKFAKNNGKVYTIGFAFNSPDFDNLSNGEGYHFNASDEASLKNASEQISQKLKPEIVDNIGSNVEYVSGSVSSDNCSVSVTNDETTGTTITWSNLAELSSGITVSYKVKVINSDFGSKKLNGDAAFNCIYKGERKTFPFPMPSVEGAKLTVNFVNENNNPIEMEGNWIDWIGLTSSGVEFRNIKEIPNTFTSMDGKTYYLKSVADPSQITNYSETTNTYAISSPTEAKEYVVTVTVTENIPQPETYTVIYDANGGAWDWSFSKDGYNLNATSGADKLTKENASGEETLEILSGNDLPTRADYDFDGWYLDGQKLTSEMTVAAAAGTGTEVVVEAHWTEKKPEVPSKPKDTEIVPAVIVECLNAFNSGHEAKQYDLNIPNSYEIGEVRSVNGKYVSTVKVFGVYYAEKYNTDVDYDHVLTTVGDITYDLTWNADTKTWEAPALTSIPTIKVNCAGDKPEKPVDTEIVPAVIVECLNASNSGHEAKQYDLNIPNSYEIGEVRSVNGKYVSTVTVISAYYAMQYNADVHYDHAVTVENITYDLTWDADTEKWKAPALTEIPTIKVNCAGDKPEKPVDTEIVPAVIVECLNASNSGHEAKQYDLNIPNSYEIGEVRSVNGKYVSKVKVIGAYYAMQYNADVDYDHAVTVEDITYDLTWNPVTKKWEAPALTSIPTIKVDCSKDTPIPTDPELPGFKELEELIERVVLVHTGSNAAAHPDEEYTLMEDGYEISWYGTTKAILTVKAAPYVNEYIAAHGNHDVKGAASAKLILARTDGGWDIEEGTTPIRFFVKCTENNPEKPALPEYDDLKKLFGETINVTCETDEQHTPQSFGLMAGTYSVTRDKEDDNEAVVTVFAKDYIKAYADGKHTNAGDDAATVKLFCDEDGKWYSENHEIMINFKAKCEKTSETPEKQYTEIKFVVVNGTFTENGQTELTKTFEVGTKLTLADIPASKGKSSSYSDQTWDKFPVGYVVGKDRTTFTITYRWRSSGSDSDDSDYDYGTSTRGKATNAAGKSGRWILEGGEFTEDNGRLPSNEYLKIGDTIYGFYTYGFAIDFDRPEYYTDAAIQAKGGYRDATGTWRLNGWWFCYDDGTFPHDEWVYLTWNGRSDWYYFDVDGWMEDGWLYRNNNWYYLHTQYDNTRGRMYTGWHEIDGKWYYFNTASDKGTLGAMLANTTTPDGYQVDANGAWIR